MRKIDKNNRYLPLSVGIEVESESNMMQGLRGSLKQFFPSGNSESRNIFECQTVPMDTKNPIDILLLGEVTRRCIPNYTEGGSDIASCSAHSHVVGFPYELEEDHIEALMVGLMPFLSISWNRAYTKRYYFRASVSGANRSVGYSGFLSKGVHSNFEDYGSRLTWMRNLTDRYQKPSAEIRANENSPLWVYFITPLLTDQNMVDKLQSMCKSPKMRGLYKEIVVGRGALDHYSDFIEEVTAITIPFLLDNLGQVLTNVPKAQRDFMEEIFTAYLTEDEATYDNLVTGLIAADEEMGKFFALIDDAYLANKSKFNIIKGA